jgi:tRNA(Ile)-lysidine synthase
MNRSQPKYPVPGPVGGRLIRLALKSLREDAGLHLPLSADILIAVSGGSDSVALALLLVKYGRRIVPRSRIQLLHLNHGWRGKESDGDEQFVRELAQKWDVPCEAIRLKPAHEKPAGRSPEDFARELRKKEYARHQSKRALIFTAHHADDLAETVLWRLCTGGFPKLAAGILPRTKEGEVRPLLRASKAELREFLKEEGQAWREDRTNQEGELLRTRMRRELAPVLEKIFPAYRESILKATAPLWTRKK